MSKRFSKFNLFGLVLTLFILFLAILFTSCNDDDDNPVEKVFSSDGIVFTLNESWGCYEVTGYNGNADYVLIPSMYQSRKVTKIADKAFLGCTQIVEIRIEDGVKEIGSNAFGNCSGLSNITIPYGVENIGSSAFYNCFKLEKIIIPISVRSIGSYAFWGCTSLNSIEIPFFVRSIGSKAFAYCTRLANVTVEDCVPDIGSDAFHETLWYNNQPNGVVYLGKVAYNYKGEMKNGTSIVLKDGTRRIAECAFYGCSKLVSITIPNSVYGIGESAFQKCTGLTNIELPKDLSWIGQSAFAECSALTEVHWNPIKCVNYKIDFRDGRIFGDCTNLLKIFISKECVNVPDYFNLLGDSKHPYERVATIVFDGTKSEWESSGIKGGIYTFSTVVCSDGIY